MTMPFDNDGRVSRRDAIAVLGGTIVVGSAGCLEGGGNGNGNGDGNGTGDGNGNGNGGNGNGDGSGETYTIGMVDSLTGSLSPYGERNEAGRELALEDINDAGLRDGGELDVIVEDDQSESQPGVSAAQKLVNQDEVPLIIGTVGSGVSIAIHDSVVQEADGVVQISQNSTSPELTEYPDLLRASPSGSAKGAALADLIAEDGHDSVAVTWINNDYGQGLADVFEETFEGDVAYISPHDQGDTSYRGTLTEMADAGASAWLFITYAEEFTVMVNEAYDSGYHEEVDYYGAESTIADEILENTEPGSQNGLTGITESAPEDQENYEEFAQRFEEQEGEAPTVWSAYAYDAVTVAALAIEAADEFTGSAIGDVVRDVTRPDGEEVFTFQEAKEILQDGGPEDIDYQGVSGPMDLDENGDPPGNYQIYRVEDHEYVWGDYISTE